MTLSAVSHTPLRVVLTYEAVAHLHPLPRVVLTVALLPDVHTLLRVVLTVRLSHLRLLPQVVLTELI